MADFRTLKLSILADVDGLKKQLNAGEKEVQSFGSKVADFGKKAALAFAAATAAAAAYAGKLLVDGVKSAIEDEKAQQQLALTLQNVASATDETIKSTENYITATALATGVADDQLRPSLARLARATGDVTKAQELQTLALDIAAGTGKSLETVTNALSRAYEGSNSALTRLGIGITGAEAKSMSFEEITAKLAGTFEDQASKQADTFAGRMARLSVAFDEAKETVGAALLPILTRLLTFISENILPVVQRFSAAFSIETGVGSNVSKLVEIIRTVALPVFEGLKSAFNSIRDAIVDNKDRFAEFGALVQRLAPIVGKVLGAAFTGIGKIIGGVIDIVSRVADAIVDVINVAIKGINGLIRAYNLIPGLSDIKTIAPITVATSGLTVSSPSPSSLPKVTAPATKTQPSVVNNINVTGAIDSESTARQIAKVVTESINRGTGGGGGLFGGLAALL